ncbi:Chloroperoxidase [Globisporangium polare]
MVSITQLLLAASVAVAATFSAPAEALSVGTYFRPIGSKVVSGVPGNTAPYRRSPCPGLNSLANHGYLPRNGQNISHAVLTDAIMSVYNLGPDLAAFLVSQVPDPISLDYLSTHNLIEHDASLVHADAHFGNPPNEVSIPLVVDFLARADKDGRIGIPEVGQTRKDRLASCLANNPECKFETIQSRTAFAEGAAFLSAMGGRRQNDTISVAHALSFLVLEMIPLDYKKAEVAISLVDLSTYSAKIAAYAI